MQGLVVGCKQKAGSTAALIDDGATQASQKNTIGYKISVLDLRNPTCSDGDNILQLVNRYMDAYMKNPENLTLKAYSSKRNY